MVARAGKLSTVSKTGLARLDGRVTKYMFAIGLVGRATTRVRPYGVMQRNINTVDHRIGAIERACGGFLEYGK